MRVYYTITDEQPLDPSMHHGFITKEFISHEIPDYKERIFNLSGPNAMVTAFNKTLLELGVPRRHIKTDFFPGFA